MTEVSLSEWGAFISQHPDAHILQSGIWGEFKAKFGWNAARLIEESPSGRKIGVQVLFRQLPLGRHIAYIPKGPVGESTESGQVSDWEKLWPSLDKICKSRKAIFLKVEPDLLEPPRFRDGTEPATQPIAHIFPMNKESNSHTIPGGYRAGSYNFQPRRTILVSLRGDDDRILGRMKQKTRYNVRLALKRGVVVRPCTDLDLFYNMVQVTSDRDTFEVHSREYYTQAYETFHPRGMCELFVAEFEREPLAALMVFAQGGRAWYFYGASSNAHREKMPTYLLQWEAMRWARSIQCSEYDLWGVPDEDEEVLEENFTDRSDGLWGVYRFKRGFGGRVYRAVESWDRVYNSTLYRLYKYWLRT